MTANRRRGRAGRGAVLWGLGLFACLQLALLALTDSWLVAWRDPIFALRAARLRRRAAGPSADAPPRVVVVLGSSHVLQGIPGLRIEERLGRELGGRFVVCNLGLPAATPLDELLTWERLRDEGIRPDLLLIEASPISLDRCVGVEKLAPAADRLSWHDLALLRRAGIPSAPLRRPWLEAVAVPAHGRRRAILSSVLPSLLPPEVRQQWTWPELLDESGWFPLPDAVGTPEARRAAVAHLQQDVWPDGVRVAPGGLPCQALGQILRECRARGIPAALLVMPESPEFRSWYRPEEWRQVEGTLDRLGRGHGAPVIGARDWLGEEAFADGHHLLPAGAARFADRLTDEFLLPFFRARPTTNSAATASPKM